LRLARALSSPRGPQRSRWCCYWHQAGQASTHTHQGRTRQAAQKRLHSPREIEIVHNLIDRLVIRKAVKELECPETCIDRIRRGYLRRDFRCHLHLRRGLRMDEGRYGCGADECSDHQGSGFHVGDLGSFMALEPELHSAQDIGPLVCVVQLNTACDPAPSSWSTTQKKDLILSVRFVLQGKGT
jgi:hypothetical protein